MMRYDRVKGERADGFGAHNKDAKRQKRRVERRRAKRNPECTPAYRRFKGYVS